MPTEAELLLDAPDPIQSAADILDAPDVEAPSAASLLDAPDVELPKGFIDSFTSEVGAIADQYVSAWDDPEGAVDSVVAAAEAFANGDVDIGKTVEMVTDAIAENPAGAAGQFAAQLLNPINLVPMGSAAAASRAALKLGKAGAVATGITAGTVSGGSVGLLDEALRAKSEGREITSEEAMNAVTMSAALTGPLSAIPAHMVATKKLRQDVADKTAAFTDELETKTQAQVLEEAQSFEEAANLLEQTMAGPQIKAFRQNLEAEIGYVPPVAKKAITDTGEYVKKQVLKYTPEVAHTVGRGVSEVTKRAFGKSEQRINDIAKRGSKTAHSLYTSIAGSASGRAINSFEHNFNRMAGPVKTAIKAALKDTPRKAWWSGKLEERRNREIMNDLRSTDFSGKNKPEVTPEGIAIRKQLDKMFEIYEKSVPNSTLRRVDNYLTRVYDLELLSTPKGFKDMSTLLMEHGWDRPHAEGAVRNLVESDGLIDTVGKGKSRLEYGPDGKLRDVDKGELGKPGAAKERSIVDVPEYLLSPFLRKDVQLDTLLNDYVDSMSRHITYAKEFGESNEFLNDSVKQIEKELKQKGKTLSQSELNDIYNLSDALRFQQKPLDLHGESTTASVHRIIAGANKVFIPAIHLLTLPLATVASLAEIAIPLAKVSNRPSAYWAGIKQASGHAKQSAKAAFKDVPEHDATRAVSELNIGFNAGFKRLVDSLMPHESRKGAAISSAFFKLNLLDAWTRFAMVAANETGKAMIKGHLEDLTYGRGDTRAYKKDLANLRVDINKGIDWVKRGADEADPFFQEQVKSGGLNFTQQTVMLPNPSSLPLWHSNPRFRLIAQLKSFPTMFGNTVMTSWGNQLMKGSGKEKAALAVTAATATMIGIAANAVTDVIRHGAEGNPRRRDDDPDEILLEGLDRSGIMGPGVMLRDMARAPQFGRSWITVLAGPAASFAEGGFKAATHEKKLDAMARYIPHLIPGVNINKHVRQSLTDTIKSLGD